ncbi:MAG TPA: ATP-binding protein [Thermoanaerobaculia bacterium]|nr:ATP-binding protein [Thermoanaerobaculia bacterium]
MAPPQQDSRRSPRLAGFEAAFREERQQLFLERARFLLKATLVLYPAFWLLDVVVAPEMAGGFLAIRAAVCVLYLVSLAAVYSRRAHRLAQPLVMLSALASAAGIAIMSARLGGFESNYFAGNMIVLFVIGTFLPWEPAAVALLSGLIIATDFGINLAAYGPSREMVGPMFFLLGSAVFTSLATLSSRRTRRRDLSLRLRLQTANEELKELDRAKSRFFANVSHELRTPLTLLLGPLETLLDEAAEVGNPERQRLLQSMISNARRLLRQVDALLESARLESGRLRLEPEEGNIGELLGELVAAAVPLAQRRGIELVAEDLDTLPDGTFDPEKVEIIASNLVSNALKFTPEGGRITVRGVQAGPVEEWVTFEVEDTGPGIPAGELDRIFARFHQVAGTSSGTGLGLALSRELARLHGGDVLVVSEMGKGSRFRVELPREARLLAERRRQPRRREDQLAQARAEALTVKEYARRSLRETLLADVDLPRLKGDVPRLQPRPVPPAGAPRILLVEDNEELRGFMAQRLSSHYQIEEAADGAAGLAAARRAAPDLIVSDVMMPVMDGYELCRRLRADPGLATLPVILLTARAGSEAVVEGLEVGATDYVVKPFALRELEARIAAHLRARETERQLHERESRLVAIGQMTSSVVHDLRNPLTLLKGYADLAYRLAVRGGETVIAEELEQVQAASDRLRRMIEEILDFARGGTPTLLLESVPARRYLDETLTPLAADLEERGVATEIHLRLDDEQKVTLDRDRMQRVLENLLKNAREAVMAGTGPKRVFLQAWVEDGALALRVADTGPGIPGELAGHLFEPFATTGKKHGTGLGLVTVRNLVKAHGGEIRVETAAPEGGAAFTVTLPLTPAESDAAPSATRTVA